MSARAGALPVIAVDGPAGAGKSTLARLLAAELGLLYLDTGAMYRAVALRALEEGLPLDDGEAIARLAQATEIRLVPQDDGRSRVEVDGRDVTGRLRAPEVTRAAAQVARHPGVRARLVELQRQMAQAGGAVVEGRDIGTEVLPDADVKFFVTASLAERAARRYRQLRRQGARTTYDEVRTELAQRDALDRTREVGPLVRAEGAIVVDTTGATVERSLARMLGHVEETLGVRFGALARPGRRREPEAGEGRRGRPGGRPAGRPDDRRPG